MATTHAFKPDYAIAPGETLKETLEAKGLSQSDLAIRTGMAKKTINQIVNGVAPITYETAEKLEFATGVPASFWNRRELIYRETVIRQTELEKLKADIAWLKELPVKALTESGWVEKLSNKAEQVREFLRFFGVSSVDAWNKSWKNPEVQYRGKASQQKHPGFVAAWLRMGELKAENVESQPFDAREFKLALNEARSLTIRPADEWEQSLQELFSPAGVVVILTKEIPRAGVSGATRWLTKDRALIQLSLKYKTDDHFWFTFFHEAGHILLHSKRSLFLESKATSEDQEEMEANAFSRDHLIPESASRRLSQLTNKARIRAFAKSIGISPGIVVGRLQKDKYILYRSYHNDLKAKLEWSTK